MKRIFPRLPVYPLLTRALRQHNNDVGAALASLTASLAGDLGSGDGNEALAVLQSLGVPEEAARDVLGRAGTLCDALRELGINAPEGMASLGSGSGAASQKKPAEGEAGGGGSAAEEGSSSDEETVEEGGEGMSDSEPTLEEKRLFEELADDRENQENEGYLDVTLEDEADAADM